MTVEQVDEIMKSGLELAGLYDRRTGEYNIDAMIQMPEWARPLMPKDSKPLEPSEEIK